MSSFDLGKLKFAWKGDYDVATTYEKDDVVAHAGSSWVFVNDTATAGETPSDSNTTYWDKMAQGSDLGAAANAGDIVYFDGSDYQRLGIGTAGQVLRANSGATAPEYATLNAPAVLQMRSWYDSISSSTANGGAYYWAANAQYDNYITVIKPNSLFRIDITIFGEGNTHNHHTRLQFARKPVGGSYGSWTNCKMGQYGQTGHLKLGAYPDSDYNSTPHTNNYLHVDNAASFENATTGDEIAFRLYFFNGGTFYHNRSVATQYESGPSGLIVSELDGSQSSITWRTI